MGKMCEFVKEIIVYERNIECTGNQKKLPQF